LNLVRVAVELNIRPELLRRFLGNLVIEEKSLVKHRRRAACRSDFGAGRPKVARRDNRNIRVSEDILSGAQFDTLEARDRFSEGVHEILVEAIEW
jgi:hypothetical protein